MNSGPISPKLIPVLLITGGLVLAILIGALIGSGDWATFFVPALAAIGAAAFLVLGARYWLLIPFSLSFTFPIIPLGTRFVELPELTIAACGLLLFVRAALKGQEVRFW